MPIIKKKISVTNTIFRGLYILKLNKINDSRGYFLRYFSKDIFKKINFKKNIVQINVSHNLKKGTFRGFHYQIKPFSETKILMVLSGSIYDLAIDLRRNSKTYLKIFSIKLSSEDNKILIIPKGFAHGYLTLKKNTKIIYLVDNYYNSVYERGIRINDNFFNIKLPYKINSISKKDCNWNSFKK
jgi:dTDP-4-dehydrorhamnose 3,5-epimerase